MEIILNHAEGRVPKPGLYRMSAATYHADCAPAPSLSSSIAKLIIDQSPAHAHAAHPRLGKRDEEPCTPTRPMEIGTVAHKLILGQGADVVAIEADDYKTGAAKAERAAAYRDGGAPILTPDLLKAEAVSRAVEMRLAAVAGCEGFFEAPAEVVAVVRDRSGAWFRIMMDRFDDRGTHAVIYDVKTGEQSAAPHAIGRRIVNMAMEVQAAFYVRVIETLIPRLVGRVSFRWIFVENVAPNAVTVAAADNVTLGIGGKKIALAVHRWNTACRTDQWPAYPSGIVIPHYPEWAERQWLEREEAEPDAAVIDWDVTASPFRPLDMESAA